MSDPTQAAPGECISCGAPTALFFIAPGDRASRCPYCGRVTDLPDSAMPTTPQQAAAIEQARSSQDQFSFVSRSGQVSRLDASALPPDTQRLLAALMPGLPPEARARITQLGVGMLLSAQQSRSAASSARRPPSHDQVRLLMQTVFRR